MRAHCLHHVPFEGLGCIEPWLKLAGYGISSTRFFESTNLPYLKNIDLLIVMGGPMSVNDEDEFPWLVKEKEFIRNAILSDKPVLGVCLGAQLIASAMDARVYRNKVKEIGWYSIQGVSTLDSSFFRFPPTVEVFHWHGETFDIPPGATRLAESEGCKNQAFQLGKSVIGLQFHLEITPALVRDIVSNCQAELKPDKYVQSETEILAASQEKYQLVNNLMNDIITFLKSAGD